MAVAEVNRDPGQDEAQEVGPHVAREDGPAREVEGHQPEAGAGEAEGEAGNFRLAHRLGDDCQRPEGDHREAEREAVQPVDEVNAVAHARQREDADGDGEGRVLKTVCERIGVLMWDT